MAEKLRFRIAEMLRAVAFDDLTPVRVGRKLVALADRVCPFTGLTCLFCGLVVEYRGDIYEQAERVVDHSESHWPDEAA